MKRSHCRHELSIGRHKPDHFDGNLAMEHIEVTAESALPVFEAGSTTKSKTFDVAEAKFWTEKIDDAFHPKHLMNFREASEKASFCQGTFVNAAIEVSGLNKMAILTVMQPPLGSPTMPVFSLSKEVVGQIMSWGEEAIVVAKPLQVSSSSHVVDEKAPTQDSSQERNGPHETKRKTHGEVAKEGAKESIDQPGGIHKARAAARKEAAS